MTKVVSVRVPDEVAENLERLGMSKSDVLRQLTEIAAAIGERKAAWETLANIVVFAINNLNPGINEMIETEGRKIKIEIWSHTRDYTKGFLTIYDNDKVLTDIVVSVVRYAGSPQPDIEYDVEGHPPSPETLRLVLKALLEVIRKRA